MPAAQLSGFTSPDGVRLPTGVVLAPGTEIFYVHKTPSYFPATLSGSILTTVNEAFNQRNANVPGAIIILPGHTENVASADAWSNIKTNTKVIGLGEGDERGTFTWTTATSTVLMDVANVVLFNLRFQLEPTTGTVNVAAPFTVSSPGCAFRYCWFGAGTDANNKVTIGITTTAGATRFVFEDNEVYGAAAATMTTFLRLVGVTQAKVLRNVISCGTTAAAVGPIQALTTASTDVNISYNFVQNNATNSTACITGMAGLTGWIAYNSLRNMTDGSVAHIATPGNAQLDRNFGVNNNGETGLQVGTASV